jgi:uroporphyrinogen-III synthase
MPSLQGRRVALLESRKRDEVAALVARLGGTPLSAPAVTEVPASEDVGNTIEALAAGRYAVAVFLTGAGVNALLRQAERHGRLSDTLAALARMTIACRGPKPLGALRRNGLTVHVTTARPHTTAELVEALSTTPLRGRPVLLVHYGERNADVASALNARGARLDEVCPYVWALPEDTEPLRQIVSETVAGRVDAMLFTSQVQCRHLFGIARALGLEDPLRRALTEDVVVGAVGPVCAGTLRQLGVTPDVIPEALTMSSLITAVGEYFDLTDPSMPA